QHSTPNADECTDVTRRNQCKARIPVAHCHHEPEVVDTSRPHIVGANPVSQTESEYGVAVHVHHPPVENDATIIGVVGRERRIAHEDLQGRPVGCNVNKDVKGGKEPEKKFPATWVASENMAP